MKGYRILILLTVLLFSIHQNVFSQCNGTFTANAGLDQLRCGPGAAGVQLGGTPIATGGNAPYTYQWTPAVGLSCTNCPNPTANNNATITYTLTVYDADSSCVDTDQVTVTYSTLPTASFTFTGNNTCASTPIAFTNTSPGLNNTFSWTFGDPSSGTQNTSSQANPTHSFNAIGAATSSYFVSLTVTNAAGCASLPVTQTVTVNQIPDPSVNDFTSSPPFVNCTGQSFELLLESTSTSASTNSNYTVSWGDGTPNYSGTTFPSTGIQHTYLSQGYFSLISTVTGTNGCVASQTFNVYNGGNPAVGLGNPGSTTNLCLPTSLTFPITGTSNNPPGTIYIISSNTGQPAVTFNHPPPASYTHTFTTTSCGASGANNPNSFFIRVRAENPCGFSESTVEPITTSTKPQANFSIAPDTIICANTVATFTNTSINGIEVGSNLQCNLLNRSNWSISPATGWMVNSGSLGSPTPTNNPTTWGSTTVGIQFNTPGTYNMALIVRNFCGNDTIIKSICVEAPPVPNFTLSEDTACVGFTTVTDNISSLLNTCLVTRTWQVTFNGSNCAPSTGLWNFVGGTNAASFEPQFQFNSPGNFTIQLALTNKCGTFTMSKNVLVQAPPQVSINPMSFICAGQTVSPTAVINNCYEPTDSYLWTFTGGTPTSSTLLIPPAITFANAGSFNVQFQATNACGSTTATQGITVNPLPGNLNPTVTNALCVGATAQFTANAIAGATYNWTGPNGFSSTLQNPQIINVTAANAGTYTVYASLNGCQGASQTVTLTVNPAPIVNAGLDFAICRNAPATTLIGTPAGGTWSGTGITSAGVFNPTTVGTFTLTYTYTNANGCSGTDNVVATVNPLPTVNAGNDLSLCNQPVPTALTGSPTGGVWSGSGVNATTGQYTPTSVGTFPVIYTVTNANGCVGKDTLLVTVVNPTIAQAGPDSTVCADAPSIQFTATPASGTWTGNGISSTGLFDPTISGTFPIVYTFGTGSCLTRDTLIVIVNPLPVVDAGANFAQCISASNSTKVGVPAGGTWSGNGISATGVFNPTTAGAGTHVLTYTYTNPATGCSNSDNITATIYPLPVVNAGADLFLCNQPIPVNLTGSPAGGTWTGSGITNPSGVFTPSVIGNFPLVYTYTNANGCTKTDTLVAHVGNPSNANAGLDSNVCINAPNVNFTGSPAGGTWTGLGITSGGIFDPTVAGNFNLVYNIGSGTCVSRDTLTVTVNPLPIVNAGTDFAICLNAPAINLTATPAGGTWSGNGVNAAGNFNPALVGVGSTTLTYTYVNPVTLCSNSDAVVITVNPLPSPNAGNDIGLCNQPIAQTLTGTPAGGSWSGTGITPAGQFTPFITGSFPVVYSLTSSLGCTNRDTAIVTVSNPTNAIAGSDVSVCIDAANIQLTGTPASGTWSGIGVTSSGIFDPTSAGNFTLTYSFGSGTCLTTDQVTVTVNPLPVVDAGTDFSICIDAPVVNLTASPAGGTWAGTGITNPSGVFNPSTAGAGTYVLTYTYVNPLTNCSNFDTRNVTVNPLPTPNAGNDTTLCNQPIGVTISGLPTGGVWSGNNVTATGLFTPTTTGTTVLTYTVTDQNGCDASDDIAIQVVNAQQANAGVDQEICVFSPNVALVGLPASGTWSGTGITSAGVFTPNTAGNFNLVYTFGGGNCLTRDTMVFTVHALPIVNAGPDVDFCLTDAPENLNASPTNGSWSGTGITNTTLGTFDPTVATVGTYPVVYTYTHPVTSCINRDTLDAIVHPLPVPNFTFSPVICANTAETFTNTTSLGSTYAWDFRDGSVANTSNPTHTYTSIGFFDVQLIATSVFGCVDSITQTIEVREPPVADFSIAPDSSCAPVQVTFDNNSTGIAVTYAWDFGNGQTSTLENPTDVTYFEGVLADTSYAITLSVTNICGIATHTENVIAMPTPKSIFGTNLDVGCSPFTVQIANNSLGLPDTYFWDFGDGTTSTDGNALLSHVFTTGQSDTVYTIMLVVTNECGTDTSYHDITVLPNQVNAFFNTNVTSGCVPLTVNFTQFSTGASTYNWDFGDANTSTTFSPTHIFTTSGTFTVSLIVNDGCSFDTTTVDITVYPSPSVDFSSTPDSVCINEPFSFTNLSVGLASSTWNFGDGQTSSLTNPTHTYAASGTYQVTLTGLSQINSCTASITKPVVVSINPVANFVANPISGCAPLVVNFTNTSTNATFQTWTFGDGNSSAAFSPIHTFQNAGTYTVKLLVENANGCKDSVSQVITVYPLPVANFSVATTNVCYAPVTVSTTNLSTGAINYTWNFGNGVTSNLTNGTTTYTNAGTYSIVLTASNAYGCSDSHTMNVTVYPTPVANFTISDDTICAGQSVTFISSSTFSDSLVWVVGDGNILTGNNVTHIYGTAGNYNVQLIAYGAGGCGDTLFLSNAVVVFPSPIAGFDYVNVQNPDPLSGTVEFTNTSIGATNFVWNFGNGNSSTEVNPIERYNAYGDFLASLIAINQFGCTDTIEQLVSVDFFNGLFVPNAMYPGHPNAGVANFLPKGVGLATYEILIYDDWGNLIWQSTALDANGRPTEAWDGTFNGEPVQQDAYVWKVTATFMDAKIWRGKEYPGGKFKKSGTVTVIR